MPILQLIFTSGKIDFNLLDNLIITCKISCNLAIQFSNLIFISIFHNRSASTHVYAPQRNISRGNVAAVEPYNHTPQKSVPALSNGNISTQHQQQIIQDLALLKLKQGQNSPNFSVPESDESKLARQKQEIHKQHAQQQILLMKNSSNLHDNQVHPAKDLSDHHSDGSTKDDFSMKKQDPKSQTLPYNTKFVNNSSLNVGNSSLMSHKIISSVLSSTNKTNESDSEKAAELSDSSNSKSLTPQIATSTPLNILRSVAEPVLQEKPTKPKGLHQIPSGNLVVPPRKPVSSVAPTSITLAPKIVSHSPKVQMVAPNNNIQAPIPSASENDKLRPALPPKPNKNNGSNSQTQSETDSNLSHPTVVSYINKPPMSEPKVDANSQAQNTAFLDNLPIKAKPLTIKKQPFAEQPKLRSLNTNVKTIQYTSRRIEMPPAFLFPEIERAGLKDNSSNNENSNQNSNQTAKPNQQDNGSINSNNTDETDKSPASTPTLASDEKPSSEEIIRRKRNIGENVKAKLARRVSFDPLALLLDASLEGELELVKKTAMQVTNPSAANDEGITALHNAICAGHLEIVK